MKGVNLIPARRRLAKARRARMRKWAGGLAVCAAAILVACLVCETYHAGDNQALAGQCRQLTGDINSSNRLASALREELACAEQKVQSVRAIGAQPDWGVLLGSLGKNMQGKVVLDRLRFSPVTLENDDQPVERLAFELNGFTQAHTEVSSFILRLENMGVFDSVRLVKTSRKAFGQTNAIAFQLECILDGRSGAAK